MTENNTPKKKAVAKKATPAKKAAAKKSPTGAKRGRPPKSAPKADARDGDKDGRVQDGTPFERELDTYIDELASDIIDTLKDGAKEVAEVVKETADSVVVRASDIKKPSLRKRMLAWFKRK